MKTVQMKAAFTKMVVTNHKTEWLKDFSKFANKEELDSHFAKAMSEMKEKFTKKQHDILFCIRQRAVVVPGVANSSYNTYIEYFEEKMGYTVSEDTIRRTINKAEKLGLLIKLEGKRLYNTSQAANVIVFNRYEEVVAYRLAAEEQEREMLEKRLEEEYKANKEVLNWSHEAKSIAAARIQKKKEQQQKQQAAEQKPLTMYQKMRNLFKPSNKAQQKKFNELMAVVYGSLKKYKNKTEMNHSQLETFLLNAFKTLLRKKDTRNQAAMLSAIIKNQMSNYLTPRKKSENASVSKDRESIHLGKDGKFKYTQKLNNEELEGVSDGDLEKAIKEAKERLNTL